MKNQIVRLKILLNSTITRLQEKEILSSSWVQTKYVREKRELGMNFRRLSGDCQQLLIVRGDVTDMISHGRIDREEVYDDATQHNSNK